MCFNNDYDWYADISDVRDWPLGRPTSCHECCAPIGYGDWRRHIFQQEHEECQWCEYEELAEADEPCETHDYGETFECDLCRDCCKILAAIEAVETDEECPPHARQPAIGELVEALSYDEDSRYARRAVAMFPELKSSRMLRRYALTEEEQ